MRVGVFGGTFDPVHLGHLILAECCREEARLDQVLFVPASVPPHKRDQSLAPFAQRVAMLALAIAGHPAFGIDELEKDRAGPCFTVDTLQQLKDARPGDELCFLLGSDSLRDFPTWRQPARIVELAELLVVARTGSPIRAASELQQQLRLGSDVPIRIRAITAPAVEIASSDLRRRIADGRSIRYQVPRAVEAYIADKGLYV